MAQLLFYTHPASRGRIVRWMLEEIGAPYEAILLDYETSMKAPDYLAINPMAKVPAIRHGDTIVTETAAICAYLADAFPQAGLAPPPGDVRRGAYYRWLFFTAGPVEAAITGKALGLLAPPDQRRMAGYGSFEETVDTLEQAVRGVDYLCGDMFSAADVYVASQIAFGMMFKILPERQALTDYVGRLQQRPAAQRAHQLDEAAAASQEA